MTPEEVKALRRSIPRQRPDASGPHVGHATQPEFAALLGVHVETVRRWEQGKRSAPDALADMLASRMRSRVAPADLAARATKAMEGEE